MGFLGFLKSKKKNRVIFDTQPVSPEEKRECEAANIDAVEQSADAVRCEEHCECEANENGIFEVGKCCEKENIVEEALAEEAAESCEDCCENCSGIESCDDCVDSGCDCGSDD